MLLISHKTTKTLKTFLRSWRRPNRVATGKQPFRIKFGMTGVLSNTTAKFCRF